MRVLIVAKTRQGSGACIGGITFEGQSVRLIAANAATNEHAGLEYGVGEVWEIEAAPATQVVPPHVENIIVHARRRLGAMPGPIPFIEERMPPVAGGIARLYEGLAQSVPGGPLFIAQRTGIPAFSTTFWRPDQPLQRDEESKRIRYRYPTPDGGRTLTFVGFQEPIDVIPAGTLLRVSLAHWWRPSAASDEIEQRCYVQLSGWYPSKDVAVRSDDFSRPPRFTATEVATTNQADPGPGEGEGGDAADLAAAQKLLKTVFGYDAFRPLQEEIIGQTLNRQDTLAVMPTGSGKSLCYQIPALCFPGLTVVVSPLIALMHDQVMQLHELGVPAAYLNSTLTYDEYVATAGRVRQGELKLLYTSPETLVRPETLVLLDRSNVECLAIDEAHCISAWGHDFRPEYRQLLPVRRRYGQAVCVAFTATATTHVRDDICAILGFRAGNVFVASFDRENLFLAVQPRTNGLAQTLAFLAAHRDQSGIIYCSTRDGVDRLAAQLAAKGWPVLPYHAGMDETTRTRNQELFSRDKVPIIVATIAFGMGINKSNVRFVLHYNLPANLESYQCH
jgi:ATP-dependent DNA helicase RecQ